MVSVRSFQMLRRHTGWLLNMTAIASVCGESKCLNMQKRSHGEVSFDQVRKLRCRLVLLGEPVYGA